MNQTLLIGSHSEATQGYIYYRGSKSDHQLTMEAINLLLSGSVINNLLLENSPSARSFCEVSHHLSEIHCIVINGSELHLLTERAKHHLAIFLELFPEFTAIYIILDNHAVESDLSFMTRKFFTIQYPNFSNMHLSGTDADFNKHSVVISGSCVARDSMEINNLISPVKLSVDEYIGRNSIAAINSKRLSYSPESAKLPSAFLTKCISCDLDKTTVAVLLDSLTEKSLLLIDFMDERFDLVETNGTLITNSWDYRETKLCKSEIKAERVHSFYGSYKLNLWKKNIADLFAKVGEVCAQKNIIIFLPSMTRVFYSKESMLSFDENKYKINEYNEMLGFMREYLIDKHPGIKIVEPLPWMLFCDYRHRWGGHPYHYNNYMYMYFSREVKKH